jgi:tetratricopeptide (TPR) repeat protein
LRINWIWLVLILFILFGGLSYWRYPKVTESFWPYGQGCFAWSQHEPQQALALLKEAEPHFPFRALITRQLAEISIAIDQPEQAYTWYQKSLFIDSQDSETQDKWIQLGRDLHQENKTIETLETLYMKHPKTHDLSLAIGQLTLEQAKAKNETQTFEKSNRYLKLYLKHTPNNEMAKNLLAESLYRSQAYVEALTEYCSIFIKHPQEKEAMLSVALALEKNHEYTHSARILFQAAEQFGVVNPQLGKTLATQAQVIRQKQEQERPTTAAQECVSSISHSHPIP